MSHGDSVTRSRPGFAPSRRPRAPPFAAVEDPGAASLRRAVPPRGACTPSTARTFLRNFAVRRLRLPGRLDDGRLRRRGDRGDPAAGRGDERVVCAPLGRRRLGGDGAAAPSRDRRPAGRCIFVDNGLLRKEEAEQVVSTFREPLRAATSSVADARRAVPRRAGRRRGAGAQAQDHRRTSSSTVFEDAGAGAARSAVPRAGDASTPTVIESTTVSGARRRRSRRTTTSAGCRSG